jgi:UDP-hydrolysing UDP-N-acetyl-D-glucosamine 2-epimerase
VKRRIAVVTGSRAEYGLLQGILSELDAHAELELQLIVTGMHLAPEFGYTVKHIEADGFRIAERIEMLLSSDTAVGMTKSVGVAVLSFGEAYARLQPDVVLVLGDRFEIFAAAQAAMLARIPIAHIAGGDTTEGAIDEAIRHSITKMAHLHFVTNELSRRRVLQLGESPEHVHLVGSPGIDAIRRLRLLSREELSRDLRIRFRSLNLLVTFHPATLRDDSSDELRELLSALEDVLSGDASAFITMPNADSGGREIARTIEEWCAGQPNAHVFVSLGQLRYLSLMSHVDVVVGNSSSGLYEAPSFKVATVDIGDRQRGRLAADSVVRCSAVREDIKAAIERARALDCSNTVNPYGDGDSARRIVSILGQVDDYRALLHKRFNELQA